MESILFLVTRLSVVLVLGWLAMLCQRKWNPRWTILTSRALLIAVATMPFMVWVVPSWSIALIPAEAGSLPASFGVPDSRATFPIKTRQAMQTSNAIGVAAGTESTKVNARFSVKSDGIITNTNRLNYKSPGLLLGIIWLLGAAVLLIRVIIGWGKTTQVIARSVPAPKTIQNTVRTFLNGSDEQCSSINPERIRLSDEVTGPCSAGWMRPTILLPSDWAALATEKELRTVIAHEASHVKGRDLFWDLLAKLCQAMWWFHPVMWVLPKQHRLACEHLSDAAAASIVGDTTAYRRQLAAWALQFNQILHSNNAISISMADRTLLQKRLQWLKSGANSHSISQGAALIGFVAWMAVSAVFSSLSIVRAEPVLSTNAIETPYVKAQKESELNEDGKPFKVQVRDENGKPVKKAKVGISYVYKDQDGDDQAALLVGYKSVDERGEITVEMPSRAVNISVEVLAEDFIKFQESVMPPTKSMVARLKRGRIIKVRAVDSDGKLMNDVWPVLGGVLRERNMERLFEPDGKGIFISRPVRKDRRWMRVVGITEDDNLLFSDLIDTTDANVADEDGIIQVKLSPGIKLKGKLDEAVPRPIKNGFVDLCIAEAMGHRIPSIQENQSFRHPTGFIWREIVPVKEDGTFVVESLPPGGHLQLFALVEGFQSRLPTVDEIDAYVHFKTAICAGGWQGKRGADHRILPQLYPLRGNDSDGIVSVTVPCTPTAELQVKVLSPTGDPVKGAKVTICPNGRYLPNISFIPGHGVSTSKIVRGQSYLMDEDVKIFEWINSTLYNTSTNKDGIVTVRMPGNHPWKVLTVKADGYQMPIHPSSSLRSKPWRHDSVAIVPGESIRKSITMERIVD